MVELPETLQYGILSVLAFVFAAILRMMYNSNKFTQKLTTDALDGMRKVNETFAQISRESSESSKAVVESLDKLREAIENGSQKSTEEHVTLGGDHKEIILRMLDAYGERKGGQPVE